MASKPLYHIRMVYPHSKHDGEVFRVEHYRVEGALGPETRGQVIYLPQEGLEVSMWCREKQPRAIYHNPNDPVHTDSCM